MPNIKFNYRYRDGGNYKKFTSVIFSNPNEVEVSKLEVLIKSRLISETWFYAEEWKLPEIFTDILDFRIDPTWHEFESVECTNDTSSETFNLDELIKLIEQNKQQ